MIDVLQAYRFFESGQLSIWLGDDPPNHLVEGLGHYHTALLHCRSWRLEQDRQERKGKNGSHGRH